MGKTQKLFLGLGFLVFIIGGIILLSNKTNPKDSTLDTIEVRKNIASGSAEDLTFGLDLTEGKLKPEEIVFTKGDKVKLSIGTDQVGELHLHEPYELEVKVSPEKTVPVEFTADTAGRFAFEFHPASGEEESEVGTLIVNP